MTIAAEQFGTNIRATVTTTAPNFVRGALVPVSLLFQYLRILFNGSIISAGIVVAVVSLAVAYWALHYIHETFFKRSQLFRIKFQLRIKGFLFIAVV